MDTDQKSEVSENTDTDQKSEMSENVDNNEKTSDGKKSESNEERLRDRTVQLHRSSLADCPLRDPISSSRKMIACIDLS